MKLIVESVFIEFQEGFSKESIGQRHSANDPFVLFPIGGCSTVLLIESRTSAELGWLMKAELRPSSFYHRFDVKLCPDINTVGTRTLTVVVIDE